MSRLLLRAGRLAGLAVLAVAVVAAWGVANYQPLRTDTGGASGATGRGVAERGEFLLPDGRTLTAFDVAASEGSTFSFWFSIENDGPFGVTLSRIGLEPGRSGGFPIVRVMANPRLKDQDLRAFHPMSLAPGHAVDLQATIRVMHCPPAGKRVTFAQMPVTFRVLGVARHTTLELPETLTVKGCG